MGLRVVFDSISAELGPEVAFVGPERKDDQGKFQRISWDPKAAEQKPPQRIGGGPGDDGHIMSRHWIVEVEVWGKDFDSTEDLVNRFLSILHDKVTAFSYRPGEEKWNCGGVTAGGSTCTMMIVIVAPIPRTAAHTLKPAMTVNFRMNETIQTG